LYAVGDASCSIEVGLIELTPFFMGLYKFVKHCLYPLTSVVLLLGATTPPPTLVLTGGEMPEGSVWPQRSG
jgi:hypothetical protein